MTSALQILITLLLGGGALIATARAFGALARRARQPAVVGELLAGVLLGPTVFGALAPAAAAFVFPASGAAASALDLLVQLALALFMLTAGLEVDLSTIVQRRRVVIALAAAGTAVPFALGFGAAWLAPARFGAHGDSEALLLALFLGTALSISALPVIARILKDIGVYQSELGMLIVGTAFLSDFAGWTLFALTLGMLVEGETGAPSPATAIGLAIAFALFTLSAGRSLINRAIERIHRPGRGSARTLALVVWVALLGSAFTEWLGLHAVFGAFLVGVATSRCPAWPEASRATLKRFVSRWLAPLFFASIGTRANFAASFDAELVAAILLLACLGKLVGCGWTARRLGMSRAHAWAAGLALNARGAMEMVLAATALEMGVIAAPLFVALVVMALLTSLASGPLIQRILAR